MPEAALELLKGTLDLPILRRLAMSALLESA
jgi:hypothetical protein